MYDMFTYTMFVVNGGKSTSPMDLWAMDPMGSMANPMGYGPMDPRAIVFLHVFSHARRLATSSILGGAPAGHTISQLQPP